MAAKSKRRSFESSLARRRVVLAALAVAAIGLFIGGMFMLTRLGPRPVQIRDEAAALRAERGGEGVLEQGELGIETLRAEIRELEQQFDTAVAREGADLASTKPLDDAVALQTRIIGAYPRALVPKAELDEMDRLLLKRDSFAGRILAQQSLEAEARARSLLAAEDYEGAIAAYGEAVRLQARVNDDHALSQQKSIARLRSLEKARDEIQAIPLNREVESLVERARADAAAGNFVTAGEWIGNAIDIQRRINREFRQTKFASQFKLQNLEREQIDYRAGELQREINEATGTAALAETDERYDDAAAAYLRAFNAQKRINRDFPRSSFASEQKLETLEAARQTAQSRRLIAQIGDLEAALLQALRSRDAPSIARTVADYYRARQSLQENFPKSRFADPAGFERARFLYGVIDVIPSVQAVVDAGVLAVPEHGGIQMFNTEVNQLFYQRVTGSNPASVKGDLLPVESVSWQEAVAFCRQLGWILGCPVRLPTRAEATAALGDPTYINTERMAWNSVNSARSAQAVATVDPVPSGFFDLLGNVAEWLDDPDAPSADEALVFGGSARDNPAQLERVPVVPAAKSDRNRFTGFRFVLDLRGDGVSQ